MPATVDPQGDAIRYAWTFGDTGTSTSANPSRTYAAPGTYTVTLTATDVWGRFTTVTHDVTMTEPAGNTGPTATFVATCTVLTCAMNSTGTVDPEGHTIKGYSWNWGDGTALSTGASPSHTYTTARHLHDHPDGHRLVEQGRRAGHPRRDHDRAGRQHRARPP